jgi:hypothetical protein
MPALAVALFLLLLAPAWAQAAGDLELDGGDLEFEADSGVNNVVSVTGNEAAVGGGDVTVTITDTGDVIDVDAATEPDCSGDLTNTVTCTADIEQWELDLGDGNDTFTATGTLFHDVFGGAGDDLLTGSDTAEDDFEGDLGADTLRGGGGPDSLYGGADNDNIDGGAGQDDFFDASGDGSDSYQGGEGIDFFEYFSDFDPGETQNVDLIAGTATRSGSPEVDTVLGVEDVLASAEEESGTDVVVGTDGSNDIDVEEGNDNVNPRGGGDTVSLDAGDDTADLRDGANDRVTCGEGVDTVLADQFDELVDCENVTVEQLRPANADLLAPACTVTKVRRVYGRKAFFRGFRPDVDCSEPVTLDITLVANVRRGRLVTSRVGDIVLAQKRVLPGATVPRVKAARRFARQLRKRRGFRARLVVRATDEYGNRATKTKRIKVKKAKRKRTRRGGRRGGR